MDNFKNVVDLWAKYCKSVEEDNKPMKDTIIQIGEQEQEEHKKRIEEYEQQEKRYKSRKEAFKKRVEEWDNLPWFKKLTSERPYMIDRPPFYPMPTFTWMSMNSALKKPSWVDFLNWCSNNKQKLQ